jgi:S-DNA-T family DNA segregation ATPase FtsK/SpoIIIE
LSTISIVFDSAISGVYFFFIYNKIKAVNELQNRDEIVQNWLGKFGAFLAHILIYKGFG